MTEIQTLIKGLRASGLSQSAISRRTGIPQPRISRWEAGGTVAANDALKLLALAKELGTTARETANG